MGEYADVKRKKILKLLKWLDKYNDNIDIDKGGKHTYVIRYSFWSRPYPIPFKHGIVDKNIVKSLMKQLVGDDICTKEEFDNIVK